MTSATLQQGASIARVTNSGRLLVVADVIEPSEQTCFAARRAADVLCRHLHEPPEGKRAKGALLDGLHKANEVLFDPDALTNSIFALAGAVSLGTILVSGSDLILATVGSTRCYRVRDGELTCVDKGHSATDALAGSHHQGTPPGSPDALVLEHRDLVTEALGLREKIKPNIGFCAVLPGDRFLLCTSAVWASVSLDALSSAIWECASVDEVCQVVASLVWPTREGFALVVGEVPEGGGDPIDAPSPD